MINTVFDTKLTEFIKANTNSTYFHSEEYYKVLQNTGKLMPLSVKLKENDTIKGFALGELSSQYKILPVFSNRTIFYSEPLYDTPDILDKILKEIKNHKSGIFVQIRPFREPSENVSKVYFKNGFNKIPHLNAFIELDNIDTVLKNFERDKRRGINLAEKKYGITINEPENISDSVKTFYDIISRLFRKNKLGLKSYEYFYNFVKLSAGKVRIAFAYYMDKPIATQLFTVYNNKITALYTATLREHNNKHAGDLLIWYLINLGFKYKIKLLDFGGAGNPDRPYPPRDYKKRFGAVFENAGRFTYFKYPFSRTLLNLYYKHTS